jgi:hypothetical protein
MDERDQIHPIVGLGNLRFNAFTLDELESLQLFHKQVEKMNNCKVIKNESLKSNYHMDFVSGNSYIYAPDEDELVSFLTRLRPFLLEKDRIFINAIFNTLKMRSANEETRRYLKALHKNYKEQIKFPGLRLHANGKEYSENDLLSAYFNGELFHVRDEEPRKVVESFKDVPGMTITAIVGMSQYYYWCFVFVDRIITSHIIVK